MEVLAVNDGDRGAVGFKMAGIGGDQSKMSLRVGVVRGEKQGLPVAIGAQDAAHSCWSGSYTAGWSGDQRRGRDRAREGRGSRCGAS